MGYCKKIGLFFNFLILKFKKEKEKMIKSSIKTNYIENKNLLTRHRFINELLSEEISKIRACSLHTLTINEWEKKNGKTENSPTCAGGSKK